MIIAAFALFCAPCSAEPLIKEFSHGPVKATIILEPGTVQFNKSILLTIKITAPSEIETSLPDITDRLQGFILSGMFDKDPYINDGKTTRERHVMITPALAQEYRIAPMPVSYTDTGRSPAVSSWFPTEEIILIAESPAEGDVPGKIETNLEPRWIYPPFSTVLTWLGIAAAAGIAIFLIGKLGRRIREQVRIMRMSPRERALRELTLLMAKDLVKKEMVKLFYIELTMIVRRYIERLHTIRAPEQTTYEFLQEVRNDPRFSKEVIDTLSEFLESADLVKFAAYHPSQENVDGAISTARNYIEKDTAEATIRKELTKPVAGGQ